MSVSLHTPIRLPQIETYLLIRIIIVSCVMKSLLPNIFRRSVQAPAVPSIPLAVVRAALNLEKKFAFYHELPLDNFNQSFWHITVMGHPHDDPRLARPEMTVTLHCQKDHDHQLFRKALLERNGAEMDRLIDKGDHMIVNITMPDDQVEYHLVTRINGVIHGLKTRSFDECMDETLTFIQKTSPQSIRLIAALSSQANGQHPRIPSADA